MHAPPTQAPRWTLVPPALALAAVLALTLAWSDVLPGAWRLRGYVEPHALGARRDQARRAAGRLMAFREENREAPGGATAFLGSSTMERFPLALAFPGKPCLNRGIGNESAPQLVRRLEACLPAEPLRGALVFSGRVELLSTELTPEEIRRRVAGVLDRLGELQPEAPVALIGLLAPREASQAEIERLDETNRQLRALALERGFGYVDTARSPMRDATGSLPEALSADRLHLNDEGYRVLARWILEDGGEAAAGLR